MINDILHPEQVNPDEGNQSGLHNRWVQEIQLYDREADKWVTRSRKIQKRYKDERQEREISPRYNILWSNVQTMKPAIYGNNPKPEVERRFKDEDPVGRVASDVLERAISYSINCENQQFEEKMNQVVLDRLLPGRGIAWERYVPHMRDVSIAGTEEVMQDGTQITDDADEEEAEQEVFYEECQTDYVHWQDFGHTIGRTWDEVTAVWRKTYITREELVERFGDKGALVPLDHSPSKDAGIEISDDMKKATIYEIWDKKSKKAIWLSKNYPDLLDIRDDPLKLEGFFPCPRPLLATTSNDSCIPVPDFVQYQDQAAELDELTARIASITKSVKVAGVYAASSEGLSRLLAEGVDNSLIPVEEWAVFAEHGGLQGSYALMPMMDILNTLKGLYDCRDRVKQDLYEITGMADIIRGANDPSSTATAEKIKSNFASIRLNDMQDDMQRFVRDLVRIKGEIIAEHFSIDTLKQISGIKLLTNQQKQLIGQVQQQSQQAQQLQQQFQQVQQQYQQAAQQAQQSGMQPPPPPQPPQPFDANAILAQSGVTPDLMEKINEPSWEDVDALLKDNAARSFRMDIETDSTIKMDEQETQQARMQFLQAIGAYMSQGMEAVKGMPQLAPLFAQSVMFAVRSFKVGRQMESALQQTMDKLLDYAKQQEANPQKSDAEIKNDGQMQIIQAKAQADAQHHQAQMQAEAAAKDKELQMQAQFEEFKAKLEQQTAISEQQAQAQQAQQETQMEMERDKYKMMLEQQTENLRRESDERMAQMQAQIQMLIAERRNETTIEVAEIGSQTTLQSAQMSAAKQGSEE